MKITAFIFNLSRGGAQGVFVNIVNNLHKANQEIKIVLQDSKNALYMEELQPDIPICDLQVKNKKKLLFYIIDYVKKNKIETALVFSHEITVYLYMAKKIMKQDFVIISRCLNTMSYEYGMSKSFFRKYITRSFILMFYRKSDLIIAQSHGIKEDLIENFRVSSEQIIVINNPIGLKFENEMDRKTTCAREPYILYAGRLEEQKGLEMLLEAFSILNTRKIKLVCVGSGSQENKLKKKAEELGIYDRVEFVPHTNRIVEYYCAASATVLNSFYEGFPNVLVESISCGTPVVAYDLPSGPSEIILDGKNGYLVKYLDIQDLAEKIDMTLTRKWDRSSIKKTAMRFRQEVILPQYLILIEQYQSGR